MNFNLSDDQRALVDSVEKFAKAASPARSDTDSAQASVDASIARWQQMAELGLTGLTVPEESGGLGMTAAELVLVAEALGQALAQQPFVTAAVVAAKMLEHSTLDAARAHLQSIAEGSVRIAPALHEQSVDFGIDSVSTACHEQGGALKISGAKELVVDGAAATHFLVTARSQKHGLNGFIVKADGPGVAVLPIRGLEGAWLARVSFEDAAVEGDAALFSADSALDHAERALDFGTVALCAEALGLMNKMLALTASYLNTRHQFGKPIGTFQALQHRFAEMIVAAEQSRSITFMAAAALTDADAQVRMRDVSAAKSLVSKQGRFVLESAIQLHGGIGITDEYELSRYVRRMLQIEKTWGDRQYHEARFGKLSD